MDLSALGWVTALQERCASTSRRSCPPRGLVRGEWIRGRKGWDGPEPVPRDQLIALVEVPPSVIGQRLPVLRGLARIEVHTTQVRVTLHRRLRHPVPSDAAVDLPRRDRIEPLVAGDADRYRRPSSCTARPTRSW